jgi:hypothetical protein
MLSHLTHRVAAAAAVTANNSTLQGASGGSINLLAMVFGFSAHSQLIMEIKRKKCPFVSEFSVNEI